MKKTNGEYNNIYEFQNQYVEGNMFDIKYIIHFLWSPSTNLLRLKSEIGTVVSVSGFWGNGMKKEYEKVSIT